ncbi:uncharacterized protein LOC133284857 [Gastrolobium bilobum]|uniref:uncharacterized protein LOC133284857 n=1 Tax=Gastrolobium bilobum TaxID=150636 RepID=UPI002AB0BC78|nr:uncharacterized protein LOC133284857 [Gastrolobium bilobum]
MRAMATAFTSSSSPQIATFLSSNFHSKSYSYLPLGTRTLSSLPSTSPIIIPSKKFILFHNPLQRNNRLGLIPLAAATPAEDVLLSEAAAVDATEQLVSNTDGGVSTVISALLFVAFIGLSILTVGVIYLAVTDFLQKREKDKFEKEEAANKSKTRKKKVARARTGPRGFGQKIDEKEDDD